VKGGKPKEGNTELCDGTKEEREGSRNEENNTTLRLLGKSITQQS